MTRDMKDLRRKPSVFELVDDAIEAVRDSCSGTGDSRRPYGWRRPTRRSPSTRSSDLLK